MKELCVALLVMEDDFPVSAVVRSVNGRRREDVQVRNQIVRMARARRHAGAGECYADSVEQRVYRAVRVVD